MADQEHAVCIKLESNHCFEIFDRTFMLNLMLIISASG